MGAICTGYYLACCPNRASTHCIENAEVTGHAPSHRCPTQLPETLGKPEVKFHTGESVGGRSLIGKCYLIPNKTLSKSELYRGPFTAFPILNCPIAI